MNVSVRPHTRSKPKPRRDTAFFSMTEELRKAARFLNRIRVKAIGRRVEPLDSIDMPEEQKQRIRETGF